MHEMYQPQGHSAVEKEKSGVEGAEESGQEQGEPAERATWENWDT